MEEEKQVLETGSVEQVAKGEERVSEESVELGKVVAFEEQVPEEEIDANEDEARVLRRKIHEIESNLMTTVVARYRAALKAMALINEAFSQVFSGIGQDEYDVGITCPFSKHCE